MATLGPTPKFATQFVDRSLFRLFIDHHEIDLKLTHELFKFVEFFDLSNL